MIPDINVVLMKYSYPICGKSRHDTATEIDQHVSTADENCVYPTAVEVLARIEELQTKHECLSLQGTADELRLILRDEYIAVKAVREIVAQHQDIQFSTVHAVSDNRIELTVSFGDTVSPWLLEIVETHSNVSVDTG